MCAVDVVHAVVRIDEREWCTTAGVPCNVDGVRRGSAVILNLEFIAMRVSVELAADDSVVAVDDASVLLRPPLEATAAVCWKMFQDVNAFVSVFRSLKCVCEPLHGRSDFNARIHDPPVEGVAIVVVHRDQTKAGLHKDRVVAALSDGCERRCRKPSMTLPDVSWQRKGFSNLSNHSLIYLPI